MNLKYSILMENPFEGFGEYSFFVFSFFVSVTRNSLFILMLSGKSLSFDKIDGSYQ